jgi:PAS domain-containing protein
MNVYCAWCGALLRSVADGSDPLGPHDSHGICADCARTLLQQLGIPIEKFLSELGVPVLMVDDDVRVLDANPAALSMLDRTEETVLGHLSGEVFECVNSRLPGGCGRSVHCSGCTLRRTVTSTWETGQTCSRVPATLEVTPAGEPERIALLITTAKVGNRVLLRIDPPESEAQGGDGA